jgi:hypothetical protein
LRASKKKRGAFAHFSLGAHGIPAEKLMVCGSLQKTQIKKAAVIS